MPKPVQANLKKTHGTKRSLDPSNGKKKVEGTYSQRENKPQNNRKVIDGIRGPEKKGSTDGVQNGDRAGNTIRKTGG